MRAIPLLLAVSAAALASCAETSHRGASGSDAALFDALGDTGAISGNDAVTAAPDLVEDDAADTSAPIDVAGPDAGGSGFGDPCSENADCESGFCVDDYDGKVCTSICVDTCPYGWACQQIAGTPPDVTFACVPTSVYLCLACEADADCGGTLDRCRPVGATGTYCTTACQSDADCPAAFACTADGDASYCEPRTGSCECTDDLVGDSQVCEAKSAFGTCFGTRTCEGATGWSECDAKEPVEEACNGADDDCDGEIDEDFPEVGAACDGEDADLCAAGTLACTDDGLGVLCAGDTPKTEACNGEDDDCDEQVDEGYADTDVDGQTDCVDADDDGDGITDAQDNCPLVANPAQTNSDADLLGDACDEDDDNDGDPDATDCAPTDPAIHAAATDTCNGIDDDCDGVVDAGFADMDRDGLPDCADLDDDGDGIEDPLDNCTKVANPQQTNSDSDLLGDACDPDDDNDADPDTTDCAPTNPAIGAFAEEACDAIDNDCDGTVDEDFADTDADGVADCVDADDDGDGIADGQDNCPTIENPAQDNTDADLLGDACDKDDDNDGDPDETDCAPLNPLVGAGKAEICNGIDDDCDGAVDEGFDDTDDNGTADCMDTDDDGDGVPDGQDNCPTVPNPEQTNSDSDLLGDACDPDDDNDGDPDVTDCAPLNPLQKTGGDEVCDGLDNDCDGAVDEGFADTNEDGVADCVAPDDDGDGVPDSQDNCPLDPNPNQENTDGDAQGDACDPDDDNDGDPDASDCAPKNPAIHHAATEVCNGIDDDCSGTADDPFPDTDGDGARDCVDPDDDGDGVPDPEDNCPNTVNPHQIDPDLDPHGDACDADDDNDGDPDVTDCAPKNPAVGHTAAEACNGIDDDCDGAVDEGFPDTDVDAQADCVDADDDADGVPDPADNCPLLANPDQQNTDGDAQGDACDADDDGDADPDASDCAPLDPGRHAGATEACDGVDQDCDGAVDDGFPDTDADGKANCIDADDDGDGDPDASDCKQLDPGVYHGATELCGDGKDNDCNPETRCYTANGTYVNPFTGTKTAVATYSYNNPEGSSANTGKEAADRTTVWFYQEPGGALSLFVVHDKANDGDGGDVKMNVSGAVGASVLVYDDPGAANDPYTFNSATGAGTMAWTWSACCTDGALLGPLEGDFCVTLDVSTSTGITGYNVLSNGSATYKPATYGAPLVLCGKN